MPSARLPVEEFTIQGNPGRLREAARRYGRSASATGESAAALRTVGASSGSWVGAEGDAFRGAVAPMPAPLDAAKDAFSTVSRALATFAEQLQQARGRMARLYADAQVAWPRMVAARERADDLAVAAAAAARIPSGVSSPATSSAAAEAERDEARAAVQRAEAECDALLAAAREVRARCAEDARAAAETIRGAGATSPTARSGAAYFGGGVGQIGGSARDALAENRVLGGIAPVAQQAGKYTTVVGGVALAGAAILGVAGFFFPPLWAGAVPLAQVGLGTLAVGGVESAIGTAAEDTQLWADGQISGQQLGERAAVSGAVAGLSIVGGGVAGKLAGKGLSKAASFRRAGQDAPGPGADLSWLDDIQAPPNSVSKEIADRYAHRGVTEDDVKAIRNYTGERYKAMNDHLRGIAPDPQAAREVDAAVAGLDKLPKRDGLSWRGTHLSDTRIADWKPGALIEDPAFVSTTTDPDFAWRVKKNALITVDGHSGVDVKDISYYPEESEVLYKPGSRFRVIARMWNPQDEIWSFTLREVK